MRKYLLFLVALMCMANMCNREETDTYHRTVKVTNNAEYPIYFAYDVIWAWYDNKEGSEYPWNPAKNKEGSWTSEHRVNSGETNTTAMMTLRPTDPIERIGPNGYMKVFFIDATKYDQIPIGSSIPNEVLLDSRVYDLEALRAVNFYIHYPLPEE